MSTRIAFFITSHGFGHAARACAIMEALRIFNPTIEFEIFTQTPAWFFQDTLKGGFTYHSEDTDVGLVQNNPMQADLTATLQRLEAYLPLDKTRIRHLVKEIEKSKCELVVCDISVLGIAVAEAASIPSVLTENFTWDWIYQAYLDPYPGFAKYIDVLHKAYRLADHHIQTEPVCAYRSSAIRVTTPISRKPKTSARILRDKLGIALNAQAVLLTMGGIEPQYTFLDQLQTQNDLFFIIPGGSSSIQVRGNLVLLPHHSEYYHPDLLNACDAVVGKLGYSTLSEAYHAGIPFGYVLRKDFPESPFLASFVWQEMHGFEIAEPEFMSGEWVQRVPDLLSLPRLERRVPNGSEQAARLILSWL